MMRRKGAWGLSGYRRSMVPHPHQNGVRISYSQSQDSHAPKGGEGFGAQNDILVIFEIIFSDLFRISIFGFSLCLVLVSWLLVFALFAHRQ
jgi:hypothetical protein